GEGETEPVGHGARLRGRPALQPPHGPHARGGRVRLVIVRRQLERRHNGDVGGRPARLRREAGRFDQSLADVGDPPQGGERAHLGREHGEVGRVASPPFERLLQLAAVIADQMAAERQIEPIDRPAAEQAAIGPQRGEGRDHFAGAIESAVAYSPRSICSCAAKINGSRKVVSSCAARRKCWMALRESNCTMRSSPWINSWYAAKVGGWPVVLAHKLKRESNSVASAA